MRLLFSLQRRYYSNRHLTEKSDVYGLGVVLLELISGQEAINKEVSDRNPLLIEWVRALHNHLSSVKHFVITAAQHQIAEPD